MIVTAESQMKRKSLWEKLVQIAAWRRSTDTTATPESFYYYFRPIAVICRLLGVLPLKNLNDVSCKSLGFAYVSIPVGYTVMLLVICAGIILCSLDFKDLKENLANADASVLWRCVVIALMIARAFIHCFFCVNRSRIFVKLIKILDFFDRENIRKRAELKIAQGHNRMFWKTMLPLLIGIMTIAITLSDYLSFCYLTLMHTYTKVFYGIWYVSLAVLGLWEVVPLYLYIYFAFTVKNNFRSISNMCMELIPRRKAFIRAGEHQSPTNTLNILRDIKCFYILMADVVKKLNSSCGVFLAIDQFYVIVTFVVNLYVFFFADNKDVNLLYFLVVNVSLILVMVFVSHGISSEVSSNLSYTV